ncbi:hypothetical protein [Archangium lipolyticum]|uniref:hypothetical protein n=1 Tax=Archangium lipolyticum TaxID=2970465 RepID=UPI00214A58D8|nr:hypothetical protein [Archangium lipolyticum]
MTKQAKGFWAIAALVVGLGMGFSAGARQEPATQQGAVECVRDSQCDARCDGPGSGACQSGRCYCRW